MVDIVEDVAIETSSAFAVGDVLGRSFAIFGRHFVQFILLSGIILAPSLIAALLSLDLAPVNGISMQADFGRALSILTAFLQTFAGVAVLHGAFMDISGRPVSAGESLRACLNRFFPIVGVTIYQGVGFLVGLVLLIVPGFILMVMWYVALSACVIERRGALNSVNRSAALTRGHRWKIFGIIVLVTIGGAVVQEILDSVALATAGLVASTVVDYAGRILNATINAIVGVVVYHDLRTAKEGLGVEAISEVFA